MDTIRFALEVGSENTSVAALYINGQSLLDLVREVELPFAQAEGHPSIVGGYTWLRLKWLPDAFEHFQGRPSPLYQYGNKTSILECSGCGCSGCWPFLVRIEVKEETVIWKLFQQPYRRRNSKPSHWKYAGLGPFTFDRQQYDSALHSLGAERPAT